jgi:hypothetical protein
MRSGMVRPQPRAGTEVDGRCRVAGAKYVRPNFKRKWASAFPVHGSLEKVEASLNDGFARNQRGDVFGFGHLHTLIFARMRCGPVIIFGKDVDG